MNRKDFQYISQMRVREAKTLISAGHYEGAYYLLGYAVECALKACVAKQVKRHDFPDKGLTNEAHTHDLMKLVRVAGLQQILQTDRSANPALDVSWATIKDWNETSRYNVKLTEAQTRDLYSACANRSNGVLSWIRKRW